MIVVLGMFDKQECYNVTCTAFDVFILLQMEHCVRSSEMNVYGR